MKDMGKQENLKTTVQLKGPTLQLKYKRAGYMQSINLFTRNL